MQHSDENLEWARESMLALSVAFRRDVDNPRLIGMMATGFLNIVGSNEPIEHPKLGRVNRGEWLLETMLEGRRHMPTLIEMRETWEQFFEPADGRRSWEFAGTAD